MHLEPSARFELTHSALSIRSGRPSEPVLTRPLFPSRLRRITAVILLTTSPIAAAYGQTGAVTGRVLDAEARLPVAHARVCLVETGHCADTDDEGCFRFADVSAGSYTVSIHHLSYADQDRRLTVPSGGLDSLEILLRPGLLSSPEVIIRSTRVDAAAGTIPIPTEVRSGAQLRHIPGATVSDALSRIPGVSLSRDGTWETAVTIRGMSAANVVTVIDETRIESSTDIAGTLSLVNIQDLERAETIKSAGSVQYGTGAIGGVIHLLTKRPSFTSEVQVHGDMSEGFTSVNGGIANYIALEGSSNDIAVRGSFGYRNAGNTSTPAGTLKNSQYRDLSGSLSVLAQPVGDESLRLTYQRVQAENTGIPGGAAFAPTASARFPLTSRELFEAEYEFPQFVSPSMELSVRASRQEIDRNVEIIQTPALTLTPHATHTTTGGQVQSRITVTPNDLLTVGIDAWQRSLVSQRERRFVLKDSIVGERPLPNAKFFSGGLYAQNEWEVSPGEWTIMAGGRYDRIRVTNDAVFQPEYIITPSGTRIDPSAPQPVWSSGEARNESWSANIGTRVALSPEVDVTLLAATAFRSPSLEERFQYLNLGSSIHVGDPNLRPERSVSVNGGIRFHSNSLTASGDLFLNRLSDLVTEVLGRYEGAPAYVKANIGEARLHGAEAMIEYRPAVWAVIHASVAFVRGEDLNAHASLPRIPPVHGECEVRATWPGVGTAFCSCTSAATQDEIASGELRTPGYAVLSIGLMGGRLTLRGWAITLRGGIGNLTDRKYREHLSTLRGTIISEPGRQVYVTVDLDW